MKKFRHTSSGAIFGAFLIASVVGNVVYAQDMTAARGVIDGDQVAKEVPESVINDLLASQAGNDDRHYLTQNPEGGFGFVEQAAFEADHEATDESATGEDESVSEAAVAGADEAAASDADQAESTAGADPAADEAAKESA